MTGLIESERPSKRARLSYETSDVTDAPDRGTNGTASSHHNPKVFPWWKLPAELRNAIYELLLIETWEIRISSVLRSCTCRLRDEDPATAEEFVIAEYRYRAKTHVKIKTTYTFKVDKLRDIRINMLYVDSRMFAEAASMLYSRNVFHFETATVLHHFLTGLSPRARTWIRDVGVDCWNTNANVRSVSTKMFRCLTTCTNLTHVELDRKRPRNWSRGASPSNLARELLRLRAFREWIWSVGRLRKDPRAGVEILSFGVALWDVFPAEEFRGGVALRTFKRILGDLLVSPEFSESGQDESGKGFEAAAVAGPSPTSHE